MQFRFLAAALAVTTLVAFSPLESAELPTGPSGTIEHSDHPLDRADLQAWLDGLLPYAMKSGDIAGAVVAVVKDGRVLFQQGYGYADIDKRIPMDPERTMVRAGSTSKLFTWTAVMQLVEQGKIDLDRDINEYLDFKVSAASAKAVTMRDLMNHEVIVAALVGIWCLWRLSRSQKSRIAWISNTALAAALLGIVWIGLAGQLISFNLNY
jgi:CubicO group peptidase (beta-lactamase class C family)